MTLVTEPAVAQLPDTVAMTQDLEQYMQQTQESMLMTTTEQGVVAAEKSEVEEGSPSVQQTETVPAAEAESAQGTWPSITLCSSYTFLQKQLLQVNWLFMSSLLDFQFLCKKNLRGSRDLYEMLY